MGVVVDDHVGALDTLKQKLPQVPVMISRRDARLLKGDSGLEQGEPQLPIRGGIPKGIQTKPDDLLRDGDRIGSLQVVSAPGHTPGLSAFLDVRSQALIAGDAFQTRGGIAVAGHVKLWFPFPALGTWNKVEALASARKLKNLHPAFLATGHGDVLHDPVEAMDQAIHNAEISLGKEGTL